MYICAYQVFFNFNVVMTLNYRHSNTSRKYIWAVWFCYTVWLSVINGLAFCNNVSLHEIRSNTKFCHLLGCFCLKKKVCNAYFLLPHIMVFLNKSIRAVWFRNINKFGLDISFDANRFLYVQTHALIRELHENGRAQKNYYINKYGA